MFLALLALFLILIATTIFNNTLEENAAEIDLLVKRISGPWAGLAVALGWLHGDDDTPPPLWISAVKPLFILLATAGIYTLLEPDVGLNDHTLVLMVGLMGGIAVDTFIFEGGQVLWSWRKYHTPAAMRVYPAAIAIAIVCVLLTKMTDLHPGVIFGFVAAAVLFPRAGAMGPRERGMIVLIPLLTVLMVSLIALVLVDPLRDFAEDNPGVLAALPETLAVALFVGGSTSILLILIPLKFNDGEKIWSWNKWAWFALALPATFMFFHVLVNNDEFGSLVETTSLAALLATAGVIVFVSAATWTFFRLRYTGED